MVFSFSLEANGFNTAFFKMLQFLACFKFIFLFSIQSVGNKEYCTLVGWQDESCGAGSECLVGDKVLRLSYRPSTQKTGLVKLI